MYDVDNIHDEILEQISDDYEKTMGYPTWDLTRAVAIQMSDQYDKLNEIASKIDINNLSGDELTKFVLQRKGIERKTATPATGILTVTGNGTIIKDSLFETENGIQFKADETTEITNTGNITITAVIAGNSGIVGANSIKYMPVTITGITACNNTAATIGGYDAETDTELKNRYYMALQTPATSGNKYHYENWAMETAGVGGAKVFPLERGNNTVEIVIINSEKQPADQALIQNVQNYIDPSSSGTGEGMAPIGAYCYVVSATALNINVSVKLTLSDTTIKNETQAAVTNAIKNYLKEIAFIKNTVSYAQIGNVILDTENVVDYENLLVNSGTSNIAIGNKQVAVVGDVTYGQ